MHALVVSPIPSDPQNQGNSARIGRLCELLQYYGYKVHFLYYGLEGMTAESLVAMTARWDFFHFVRVDSLKRQSAPDGYLIDDWYGPEFDSAVRGLQERWRFDLALINYVWMSAACEALPDSTVKIVDTHDVFGDRQYLLQSQGLAPTWVFMSIEQERLGLNRADLVLAIQESEAQILRQRTATPVVTVGHILPANFLPPVHRVHGQKIRVGYLASNNPSNRLSFARFIEAIGRYPKVAASCHFVIAGAIGTAVRPDLHGVEAIGFVADPRTLYRDVDVVMNPNISGTGLKIKNVEALSYGMPLVSTADGMIGIESSEPAHQCATLDDMVERLITLDDDATRSALREASRDTFIRYNSAQIKALEQVLAVVQNGNQYEGGAAL